MKKLLLVLALVVLIVSCSNQVSTENNEQDILIQNPDSRGNSVKPKIIEKDKFNNDSLIVLGVYDIRAGWLFVYKFGSDTVYILEKNNDVSITVK